MSKLSSILRPDNKLDCSPAHALLPPLEERQTFISTDITTSFKPTMCYSRSRLGWRNPTTPAAPAVINIENTSTSASIPTLVNGRSQSCSLQMWLCTQNDSQCTFSAGACLRRQHKQAQSPHMSACGRCSRERNKLSNTGNTSSAYLGSHREERCL